jgi:hypothetical protein
MEKLTKDYSQIKGWGIDADPENEPTYPMKNWTGDDHQRLGWERPPLQPGSVELLRSIERPNNSATFGTSVPPSGVSGAIRRFAFRYSESTYLHWLPLLIADRVNVVEGIIDDLRKGYVPNPLAERGWKAEWKYNRKGVIKNIAAGLIVTAAIIALLPDKKKVRTS